MAQSRRKKTAFVTCTPTSSATRRRRLPKFSKRARLQLPGAGRCRAKFFRYFSRGFYDPLYVEWERGYKWDAHKRWSETLDRASLREMLDAGKHKELASRAVAIEGRTNLLFSFEKMALRDAIKSRAGAQDFAHGLYEFLHGDDDIKTRFENWCEVISKLPRRKTRVLTWPLVTVFGFVAEPKTHIFLKPTVTRLAAEKYGFTFHYHSRPNWATYANLIEFSRIVRQNLADLRPRDMIDIQSFLWVQGSDEYPNKK
jgi:hypothetical protein